MLPVQTGNKAPNVQFGSSSMCEDVLSTVQERVANLSTKFKVDSGLTITPPGKAKLQYKGKI